jgi:transcriptional regulator with XRE-family HTH domain
VQTKGEERFMTVGVMMALKDRLHELRKAASMTQQALAIAAGLSVSVIQHIERGLIPDPRMSTLRALAKALGVTVDTLIGNGDEPPKPKRRRKKDQGEEKKPDEE